ncbi:tetratricopeptide repeat protein [Psychrilyobacter sp.]|uniref:tetratricopeptide repeat protein n=1 Tax=Psychrilyobacter sp. TaxID=2586924 RepID=UPI003018E820
MKVSILKKIIELRKNGEKLKALEIIKTYLKENSNDSIANYQCAWCYDALEREKEAIPYYLKAIENGLSSENLEGAYLGLGSTYRSVGEYKKSEEIFERAMSEFPDNKDFEVFYSMTLYNLGDHKKSMEILLRIIGETSNDTKIKSYKDAILFYSDKLDEIF